MSDIFSDSESEECNILKQVDEEMISKIHNICRRDIIGIFMNQGVYSVRDMILEVRTLNWDSVT